MDRVQPAILVWAFVVLAAFPVVGCSGGPEQPILNQFFTASRLRDNTTLANFSTVAFEPRANGTISTFTIQNVTPEAHKPLNVKALVAAQNDAKAADAEYTKRKEAYERENLEAIQRVIRAEGGKAPIKGKDAEVQAAWTKFRDEGTQVSRRVGDARRRLTEETRIANLSVEDPRNPIDLTKYESEIVSKDVTISAPVRLPDGQTLTKTLVVTMQRAVLKGDKEIAGRWIITGIKEASSPGATKTS